jgi:hypothetical protein
VLRAAITDRTEVVGALTDREDTNLVVAMAAKEFAPEVRTVARIRDRAGDEYSEYVDEVYFPERASVRAAVNALTGSDVRTIEEVTGDLEILDIRVGYGAPAAGAVVSEVLPEGSAVIVFAAATGAGTLAPGESAEASFRVEVSDRAVAQSYPVEGHVEYQDSFDETRSSNLITDSVEVGPERDIDVTGSATVSAGATETVEFEVENTGGGTMYDAVARINVDSPFSTSDDTTYVGDLEPGESATVSYRVSVDSGATAKDYSVDMVAKYDNAFGDKVVTDVRKAPVEVEEGGGILAWLLGLLR